jgi:predicted RNase H-like HicB family nuclease
VIATGVSQAACRTTLEEVIEEWVLVRVSKGLEVPAIGGVKIAVRSTE